MGLRDKLKKSLVPHKIELSIGDAFVVAFNGTTRSYFSDQQKKIRDEHGDLGNKYINALLVSISLVDEEGNFPYSQDDYKDVLDEMRSSDIDDIVAKSAEVNGLSKEAREEDKKK